MSTVLWIMLAVVVIAVIVAVFMSRRKKREESHRVEAAQLRETSADRHLKLQEQEASTAGAEAEARRVRAEADQRAAEAKRLEVEAQRREKDRDMARAEHDSTLRRADALDPDIRTDNEGCRIDDDGNRVDDGPTPAVAPVHEASGEEGVTAAGRAPLGGNARAGAAAGDGTRFAPERARDKKGAPRDAEEDMPGASRRRRDPDGDGHPG